MRYDACRCQALDGSPLRTPTEDEVWKPFPDMKQEYIIKRCPKCKKPRSITPKRAEP